MAAIMGFDLWTEDISRIYLQSASELLCEVYLEPNLQLKVPAGYVLKLLQLLYGPGGSGDYWHATFAKPFSDYVAMKSVDSDISLLQTRGKASQRTTGIVYRRYISMQ